MNISGEELRNKAVKLIEDHYGSEAAKLYDTFYKDKEDKVVIDSATMLLSELLGEAKAAEQVNKYLK